MMEELKTRGRPTKHETKKALDLMSDGKPRTAADLAKELGVSYESAYEAMRSLSKQRTVLVHATVHVYRISQTGADRLEAQAMAREAAWKRRQAKEAETIKKIKDKLRKRSEEYANREAMKKREKRAIARDLELNGDEPDEAELQRMAEEAVRGAKMNIHPLQAAWNTRSGA